MDIVPITVWREARSEGEEGMCGVYRVIQNRAAASPRSGWPPDPEKVCLQSFQFSCWNDRDPQRNLYPVSNDPQYALAVAISLQPGLDPTGGATAYYDDSIPTPSWATFDRFTVQIGRLRFYRV